ncbi:unnamed protein product [Rhodiola kirilowii]
MLPSSAYSNDSIPLTHSDLSHLSFLLITNSACCLSIPHIFKNPENKSFMPLLSTLLVETYRTRLWCC